jgi:cephalosporin hydroxylase
MSDEREFAAAVERNVAALQEREDLARMGVDFIRETAPLGYSYNFRWMGRPVIQFPQDLIALQEVIWSLRPGAIIETGVARGGSLVFHGSMLELLGGDGIVVGVDIDIRAHNREAIEAHPMAKRIRLVEGSSVDPATFARVKEAVGERRPLMVILDSNHTHAHVLEELRLYAELVDPGSYLIVLDTIVEHLPKEMYPDRPWGPGDNPLTAVRQFLQEDPRFAQDRSIDGKLLITVAPEGWLRRRP